MKTKDIQFNPQNPRTISAGKYQKLLQSIQEFPEMLQLRPLVIDHNNQVLGGNMRLKACLELGIKDIPVVKADQLSEAQKKEFIVKDNLSYGDWDWEILESEYSLEDLQSWGMDIPLTDAPLEGDFSPSDKLPVEQYGVIVLCRDQQHQQQIYSELTDSGHTCKIVVT